MRILFWSNAPWMCTGYGGQTREITTRLVEAGHDVAIAVTTGLEGSAIEWHGITVYPRCEHPWGVDVVGAYAAHFYADVVLSLYDLWPLPIDMRQRLPCPWIAMTPIDGSHVPSKVATIARSADWVIAYSRYGERLLQGEGIDCTYIPHGIDCEIFKPGDKAEARARLSIDPDTFLVTVVAANKGFPCRKSWPELLEGFSLFRPECPRAKLYLHTTPVPFGSQGQGAYINRLIDQLELQDAVIIADQVELAVGVPDGQMATIYQASDVLLSPSMGEGFGLPIVEAQACERPVITQDCTAMSENTHMGFAIEPLHKLWIPQIGYYWYLANPGRIAYALTECYAYEWPDDCSFYTANLRKQYDWPIVWRGYWLPLIEKVEAELW